MDETIRYDMRFDMLPVHIHIGICRKQNCKFYGKFGVSTKCSSNHCYPARDSIHYFERINTRNEREKYNATDHSSLIGCCPERDCFCVGMKGMLCPRCLHCGKCNTIVNFLNQSKIQLFIGFMQVDALIERFFL